MMVAMVVDTARFSPFTTKSGFARMAANEIAIAASEGFISTQLSESSYCNKWMVTADGLEFLKEVMHEAAPRH
jgi:nanoRNase/pAp phosphatase (c-di-AMP/oligoRNAs hydrolase)